MLLNTGVLYITNRGCAGTSYLLMLCLY